MHYEVLRSYANTHMTVSERGSVLLTAETLNEAVLALAGHFANSDGLGQELAEVERRGMKVREIAGKVMVDITEPYHNTLLLAHRKDNPWANAAEFPWLLAGRSDIAWLLPYLPRAKDYSDDGQTWRAGYGKRMRHYQPANTVDGLDQLARVVELLSRENGTRQAVITLWDPTADLAPRMAPRGGDEEGTYTSTLEEVKYKDYPCSNLLHFTVSAEGALDLLLVIRSNDFLWGFSAVNVLNFTLLQEAVAAVLGLSIGTYTHVASNLHVYDRHFDTVDAITQGNGTAALPDSGWGSGFPVSATLAPSAALEALTWDARRALAFVEERRGHYVAVSSASELSACPWFKEWAAFMLLHDSALALPSALANPADFDRWLADTVDSIAVVAHGRADRATAAARYLAQQLYRGSGDPRKLESFLNGAHEVLPPEWGAVLRRITDEECQEF